MKKFLKIAALVIGASFLFGTPLIAKEYRSPCSASFSLNINPFPIVALRPTTVVKLPPFNPYYSSCCHAVRQHNPGCYYEHIVYTPSYNPQMMIHNPQPYPQPFFQRVGPYYLPH